MAAVAEASLHVVRSHGSEGVGKACFERGQRTGLGAAQLLLDLRPAHADVETLRQYLQASFSLLMRLDEFATQIVRIGFRHRLRAEAFARAVFIIDR